MGEGGLLSQLADLLILVPTSLAQEGAPGAFIHLEEVHHIRIGEVLEVGPRNRASG
jgi:hypothetical protein